MDELACRRPGCCAMLPSGRFPRVYCGLSCYWLDLRRLAPRRPRPVYRRRVPAVKSPANSVQHRKARDQQLELIRLELERIRAARAVTDAA